MPKKYKHATVFEYGYQHWFVMLSNSQMYCDMVNHDTKDEMANLKEALDFAGDWITPEGTVAFLFQLKPGSDDRKVAVLKGVLDPMSMYLAKVQAIMDRIAAQKA